MRISDGSSDVCSSDLASKGGAMSIHGFFIRGGQNWGHRSFFPSHTADVPEDEVLTSFLAQFYEEVPPPRLVLIDREPEELELLTEALSERAGRRVAIRQPVRGSQRRLMDQARRNAQEALDRHLAETTTQGRILGELADLFELEAPRSEEHTSELQSLMRISYAVFCLKKKKTHKQ